MDKKIKQLNKKNLPTLWLLVLAGFIGFQFCSKINGITKNENENTVVTSFAITTVQHSLTSGPDPDLKFLQTWFQRTAGAFEFKNKVQYRPGFVFHILFNSDLIRLLQTSISINAP